MDKKRGLLWWIGQIFLWIVFFPVMLFLLLLRTRKIPKLIRIPLLVLYAGLLAFAVKEVALSDREPPVIEAKEVSANYGSVIELKDIASISDLKDDNPSMAITYCDPKVGTISKDGQSVEFSKVGDYVVKVMGQDSSENISEAEITISIKDGTPPVISVGKKELDILEDISVSDIATAKDEVDSSPDLTIIACDGNAEIAKGGKSIVFKETGDYTVGVMAADESRNSAKEKIVVRIINSNIPELKISEKIITLADTDKDVDYSNYVSAKSRVYGDMTEEVAIDSSEVKYGFPGKYKVRYSVTDRDGNKKEAAMDVVIKDTTAPVIAAFSTEIVLMEGDNKPDYLSGVTAEDGYEGDLTEKVTVDDSAVDYNKAGTYTILYTVADAAGNVAKQEAKVTVREKPVERAVPVEDAPAQEVVEQEPVEEFEEETPVVRETTSTYVLNKNTKKFHYPGCKSVNQMKEQNKEYFEGTREEVIARGYDPCRNCNP